MITDAPIVFTSTSSYIPGPPRASTKPSSRRLLFSLPHPPQNQQVGRHRFLPTYHFQPSLLPPPSDTPALFDTHPPGSHTLAVTAWLLPADVLVRVTPLHSLGCWLCHEHLGTFHVGDHYPSLSSLCVTSSPHRVTARLLSPPETAPTRTPDLKACSQTTPSTLQVSHYTLTLIF